jgi:alpha-1,3-rhamnosyl/mannosyltransferase
MRIGVDASSWANRRGYGRFARELMAALLREAPEHQWICFGDERAFDAYRPEGSHVQLVTVATNESPTLAAAAETFRAPLDLLRMTRAVWSCGPDVFFSPTVYTYFPLPPRQRAVVTIHDAIAERFPHLTLPTARARVMWNLKVRLAIRQARLVLTVSNYAARDLTEVLRVDPRRIRVAVEAPADAYRPSGTEDVTAAIRALDLPPDARWFTYVGGFNPHKRVDLVIEAHAELVREAHEDPQRGPPPYLLLVGTTTGDVFHGEVERLRELIATSGTATWVRWTGFVADETLRHYHAGALAALLPSECEGFGLPAVEAAACGAAVIATTESPLPELLEGGGIFVRPGDRRGLTDAMRRLTTDGAARRAFAARALERARALSWSAAARTTLAALHEAAP